MVDAAWKRKKKVKMREWEAAVAWVEDSDNIHRRSGAKRIFANSALQAECIAIWEGLKEAGAVSKNVIIKSDCKEAIESIRNPKRSSSS